MVSPAMRRYRVRTQAQATLVGGGGERAPLDLDDLFGGDGPVRLELGCGHGELISQLAACHPDERLVGVEHDPLRVTKAAHKCNKLGAGNVRLFAADAHAFVRFRFPAATAHRIYVLFPDPWPKAGHRRRRLVTRAFLIDLARAAAPGCRLHLASDDLDYAFQMLSNISTAPGLWRNLLPHGYRIGGSVRFPTVFETHAVGEGRLPCRLLFERTAAPAPEPLPWPERVGGAPGVLADDDGPR